MVEGEEKGGGLWTLSEEETLDVKHVMVMVL